MARVSAGAYYSRWIKVALSKSPSVADAIAGPLGAVSAFAIPRFVSASPQLLSDLAWQVPLGCFVAVFIGRVVAAPYWIYQASQKDLIELQGEVVSLSAAQADLSLIFERKFPMWWEQSYWYRVGVHNSGRVSAENVEVKLISMEPNPLEVNVFPSRLGRKDGNTDGCRINPGDTDYFDVVQGVPLERDDDGSVAVVSARTPRSLALWTVARAGQTFELNPDLTYELTIRVTAANARAEERRFVMRHPRGSTLDFGLAEPDS